MILDATCGGKLIYRGLHEKFTEEELVFLDIRRGIFRYEGKTPKVTVVEPTKVGSIEAIPWPDGTFNMIIYDPPHNSYGATSFMAIRYGSWKWEKLKEMTEKADSEFYRVLKPGGILLVKSQDNDGRDRIIEEALSSFKLLLKIQQVNSSGRKANKTFWMHFIRFEEDS